MIWLNKTRSKRNLDFIRTKNAIAKVPDNFITDSGYGHPVFNIVNSRWDDIYFLSKRNKHIYNTTVSTIIEEVCLEIYNTAFHTAFTKFETDIPDLLLDPTTNVHLKPLSDEQVSNMEKTIKYRNELIKQELNTQTIKMSNRFMYNYAYGIGLDLIIPTTELMTNEMVNDYIVEFWKSGEGYQNLTFTLTEQDLIQYMTNVMKIAL